MRDYFGKDASRLRDKTLYLFDMDGTIYRENDLFDGIIEMLAKIKKKGGRYAFITNNPSKSLRDYMQKLMNMGITDIDESNFFSSAQAASMIMKEKFGDSIIFVQGTRSFVQGLKVDGLNVTENYTEEAKAILVAFDPEITGEKMRTTCEMLTKHDLPYYATNPDWVCPVSFGSVPDCGSMCEGYARATGKMPVYIGKPQPTMVLELMKKFNKTPQETLVVGDRLYTDIASGVNAGVDTVCVLCGEVTLADVQKATCNQVPSFVFENTREIIE